MSLNNSDELKDLKNEILALRADIKSLKNLLVPEISISEEERKELHQILEDMENGLEHPFRAIKK